LEFVEIGFKSVIHLVDGQFNIGAFFTAIQSGLSININSGTLFIKVPPHTIFGGVGWLVMKQDKNIDKLKYSVMIVSDRVNLSEDMVYGQVNSPLYSYGGRYCISVKFPKQLRSTPVVILNMALARFEISQFLSTWIESVSPTGMNVCMQEIFAFSGVKYNNTLNYLAIVPKGNSSTLSPARFSAGGDDNTPNEVGYLIFPKGNYTNQNPVVENLRYCKSIRFNYMYHEPPHVFITPQTNRKNDEETFLAGSVVAWVNEVSKHHATICAKNKNDAYFFGVAEIRVNYMIKGNFDSCSNFTGCPDNLECVVNSFGQPTCDCIQSCPQPTGIVEEVCGTDFVTYPSRCHMLMDSCNIYGKQLLGNITVAYPGRCKGKDNKYVC